MALFPHSRPSVSQQTDNDYILNIINDFNLLKDQYKQTKEIQHDLISNYHQNIVKVLTTLQQINNENQQKIEQLNSDIIIHIQDNETLKVFILNFL